MRARLAVLIAAAIVIPPVSARLITSSFGPLVILSTILGAACGFFGMFVSYYGDVASGPAIILLAAAAFGAGRLALNISARAWC